MAGKYEVRVYDIGGSCSVVVKGRFQGKSGRARRDKVSQADTGKVAEELLGEVQAKLGDV